MNKRKCCQFSKTFQHLLASEKKQFDSEQCTSHVEPGDVCRQALIENWVVSNPNLTQIMFLLALQETPMFADITAEVYSARHAPFGELY
mmetsp:Transcript_14889/g.22736  ORF Transcript_14889/g.22736 Transcript_14889/m.22736 type:complete len:89 (+) Transcript_14889:69-335(+)